MNIEMKMTVAPGFPPLMHINVDSLLAHLPIQEVMPANCIKRDTQDLYRLYSSKLFCC